MDVCFDKAKPCSFCQCTTTHDIICILITSGAIQIPLLHTNYFRRQTYNLQNAGTMEGNAGNMDARRGTINSKREIRGPKTRAPWAQNGGTMDAKRGDHGHKTRAPDGRKTRSPWTQNRGDHGHKTGGPWTQNLGTVNARRGQTECKVISWQ